MRINKTTFVFITILAATSMFCTRPENKQGPCVPDVPPENAQKLQIIDLTTGSGKQAKSGDAIVVHYVGTLDNGQIFDDSRKSKKPLGFNLGQKELIKGWNQGIEGMRVGGSRKLIIPPHLAYGRCGLGNIVSADATLQFDIELLEIRDEPFEYPGPVAPKK
ncbi:MAG: FKBP-type peptidyl-prolyl cis-trans isomerase [Leptospirales bacterium]